MLSSLKELLQLKFGLGHWKKSPSVKKICCYPLEPGSPVFCGNPSVHPPNGWKTFFRTKSQPTWPTCPALVMNKPGQVPASVEGWAGTFPSSVLGDCSSSALQVPKQAYKYCRLSQGGAGKHKHMLQLQNAKQHSIQAIEKTSKGLISSE